MSARESGVFLKSDERILGDSDFVENLLRSANEELDRKIAYRDQGVDQEKLALIVAKALKIDRSDVGAPGRQPSRVLARSLFCYWAVRELGIAATTLTGRFGLSQPAISLAVQRGEKFVVGKGWRLENFIGR